MGLRFRVLGVRVCDSWICAELGLGVRFRVEGQDSEIFVCSPYGKEIAAYFVCELSCAARSRNGKPGVR